MVMAFLPSAVLYIISLIVMLGTVVTAVCVPSFGNLLFLLLTASVGYVMAYVSSFRLYENAMMLADTEREEWYRVMQKIAKRCVGRSKTLVLLQMTEQLCDYERIEDIKRWLPILNRRISRSGSARLRFRYLMVVWHVKTIEQDTDLLRPLMQQMYRCLNVKSDWSRRSLRESRRQFEREVLRLRFYSQSADALSTTHRSLTEEWHENVFQRWQESCEQGNEGDYTMLSDCYNIGLTYLLTGNEAAAVPYYRYVAEAPYDYPLQHRMRQYLRSADAAVLLQTIT